MERDLSRGRTRMLRMNFFAFHSIKLRFLYLMMEKAFPKNDLILQFTVLHELNLCFSFRTENIFRDGIALYTMYGQR